MSSIIAIIPIAVSVEYGGWLTEDSRRRLYLPDGSIARPGERQLVFDLPRLKPNN